ncbi:hypothetical protein Lepto7376_1673 [[Leptolyngbya] sp. PCC 7376]|uniref:DUF6825 family protein n=1 Tax=[Leptolyngbya] sp. PCC 7376 TaxID=111781 RepID=UPI00029F4882|nr:hypothetical protein [[Leptolyngbya] sp. PCC 7376]AFY38007.1 hypothetical protein Lepto7376_1673 [[Leptolyngbya] sp. PCC 7376]
MSNPLNQALVYGRVFAEVLKEKVETGLTDVLSDLGKFDAERNKWMQDFNEEFQARVEREVQRTPDTGKPVTINIDDDDAPDLQEVIDNLRAEIAALKAELREYRDRQSN